jgi:NADPH2:quinone reductase
MSQTAPIAAVLSKAPGGPASLVLEGIPAPEPAAGQVVVAVSAVGINFPDVLIIEDKYQFKPQRPFAPGGEISGTVEAVGEGVRAFQPGDRVLAQMKWGGLAEQVAVDEASLVKIPEAMPFDEAATFMLTYGTAWHALKDRARLQRGETLLVLGAAGGVGLATVELGQVIGARVIAAVSSQEKLDLALAHGAVSGVIYPRCSFDEAGAKALARLFKDAVAPEGADVIFDPVGAAYTEPALRAIAWEGRYLVVGFAGGAIPRMPMNLPLLKSCDIVGVFWGGWYDRFPDRHHQNMAELLDLYSAGRIRPVVSDRFPLVRAADAIAHLAARKAMGKVVVTVP